MNPHATDLINSMLLPGILIISAAILLFSTNSKYSIIVNRIRVLKEEKGRLISGKEKNETQMSNVELQLHHLIQRISMVRITIVSYSASMVFFIVSCVLISIRLQPSIDAYYFLTISFIFAGLLGIVNGVVFSVIEMFKGYRIVRLEISELYFNKK
jgi:hypothetical protein